MRLNRLSLVLLGATALTAPTHAQELPTGSSVVAGTVTVATPAPGSMTLNQSTQSAIVNWNSFSIGTNGTVNVNQPGAGSVLLNRVTGNTPSTIAGTLTGTGQVFIVNPNGIAITSTGVVETSGFAASTLDISNKDFLAGNYTFKGDGSSAPVSNAGEINIAPGGYAALIGGRVSNSGSIIAPFGKIGLGSAEMVTMDLMGEGFLQVAIPSDVSGDDPLVSNTGLLSANGGYIEMTAAAANNLARNVINLSGTAEARSVSGVNGAIVLSGDGGGVTVTGTMNTSSAPAQPKPRTVIVPIPAERPSYRGGDITITGGAIKLADATIDASGDEGGGDIRIGGDWHGNGLIPTATTLDVDFLTSIKADALIDGNGGTVVLWSDQHTSFDGGISAQGKGDGIGGNVEVSGKRTLAFTGDVTTRAESGIYGNLLLDPWNVGLYATDPDSIAPDNNTGPNNYTPTGDDSVILIPQLVTTLLNNNVRITTSPPGNTGAQPGNITVFDAITWAGPTRLSLEADGAIDIQAPITGNDPASTLNLVGSSITSNSTITVGNLTAQAFLDDITLPPVVVGTIDLLANNTGGDIIVGGATVTGVDNPFGRPALYFEANGNITLHNTSVTNGTLVLNSMNGSIGLTGTVNATGPGPIGMTLSAPNGGIGINDEVFVGEDLQMNSGPGGISLNVDDPLNAIVYGIITANRILGVTTGPLTFQQSTYMQTNVGDIVLSASRIANLSGDGALNPSGRWIIYTADWELNDLGGLSGSNYYNVTYAANPPSTIAPGVNVLAYARQPVLTFTVADAMRVYYDALAITPAISFAGLVNGDTIGDATDGDYTAVVDTTAIDANVGNYAGVLRPSGVTSPTGYLIAYVGGDLDITPRSLTLTANDLLKTYGDTLAFTGNEFTLTGFMPGDVPGTVTLASPGAVPTATVAGSPYVISASNATGGDFANYAITYVPGGLTVTPRALTISANDLIKFFNTTLDFTGTEFTTAGLVNGDTVTQVMLTSAGQPVGATFGTYPIAIGGAAGSGLGNYAITYVPGTLSVAPPATTNTGVLTTDLNNDPPGTSPPDTLVSLVTEPDDIVEVIGLDVTTGEAENSLQLVEQASAQFGEEIAECERQLESNGDSGAYLTCAGNALDRYADALDSQLIKLPPELKATVRVIRQTAERVRAAASSPNPQAAIQEARAAVSEMVDFVRQQTALVRAVDPEVEALLQQQGAVMTQALEELDLQLVGAVEI